MRTPALALLAVAGTLLSACVGPPPPRPLPPAERVTVSEPIAEVVAYPARGQSSEQLDRDRYECHIWAVRQTGFDPSLPGLPPRQRVRVVEAAPPPGSAVAAGAVTGAVLGAIVASSGHAGGGAVIGALAGAAVGAASDASREQRVRTGEDRANPGLYNRVVTQDQRAGGYRRAIAACLDGRGYTVR